MKENNFYKMLREKLESKPTRDFNETFWKRFDQEFKSEKSYDWIFNWKIWAPVAAAITLIVYNFKDDTGTQNQETLLSEAILNDQELLEDLDLLEELDELALNATDEEWDMLLEGKES